MRRAGPSFVWLLLVWFALWERLSLANAISGIAVAGAITLLHPSRERRVGRPRPIAVIRLLLYFSWKLIEATVVVAWEVVTPRSRIRQGIIAVPVRGVSQTLTTVVANMITLTPGTLTVDVAGDGSTLYVHVLHLHDAEAVRRDLRHLEALVIAAFGSAAAIAELGGRPRAEALEPSQATSAVRNPDERSD